MQRPSGGPARPPGPAGPSLPVTIEGATQRYLMIYEENFRGPISERCRLKDLAEAKIYGLRKKAPVFFETKLPEIVNQAGSSLLNHDTTNPAGNKAFNVTHSEFLRVLDELKKSQPAGDISFQSERQRHLIKEDLRKQHLKIRDRIADLEAQELDVDELGNDDTDGEMGADELSARREAAARRQESRYQRIFVELDELKQKLKQVATRIALMEGESLDDKLDFKLKVTPRTMLERLDENQFKRLEAQIAQFLMEKKSRREFPLKTVVEDWLVNAGVSKASLKNNEFNDLTKDTSDAIRTFFRERENERRNEYFDSLINNKKLLPKEGIILSSPDDIPDNVREQLEMSERKSKRKLDEYCEQYSKMPCEEDKGDDVDAEQSDDELENEFERELAIFKRVKEEPRDDCEPDDGSDDEVIVVEEDMARDIERTLGHNNNNNNITEPPAKRPAQVPTDPHSHKQDDGSDISDFHDAIEGSLEPENIYQAPDPEQLTKNLDALLDNEMDATMYQMTDEEVDDDDDDELECLGVVEPQDKCPTIDLTEK